MAESFEPHLAKSGHIPGAKSARPLVSPVTQTAAFFVTAAVLILGASMMMFSTFMLYDDEGYVLLSLRNFFEHGHLYGTVYTQYGPFPFVFYAGLQALGMPLTHTAGRVITIAAWSGAAFAAGALARQGTRSALARLGVTASVFIYLWVMVSEPTHPGGLIAVLTAVMAWLGHRAITANRRVGWAILFGVGSGILLLTKINVGVFAGFSGVAWLLLHHENASIRKWAPLGLGLAMAALPFALMKALLGTPWVQTYALLFACAGVSAVGAVAAAASPQFRWRGLGVSFAAGLAATGVVLGVIWARGTTPGEMLEGVFLGPLRHPVHFSLKFPWPAATRWFAVSSLSVFGATRLLHHRRPVAVSALVAWLRLVAAVALAITLLRFPAISADNLVFAFSAPCLWFFLWPLPEENRSLLAAKNWVGLLFLGQYLHAFPVPGSQIAWGTFLAIPLAALGAWPAARWLATRARSPRWTTPGPTLALHFVVAGFAIWTTAQLVRVGNRYLVGSDLHLPGAELLRLPDNATSMYRILALNGTVHSDVLFSLPGMFSLNLWTGVPTPTLTNVTHWFSLLSEDQQQAIIAALDAHPRACVVVQRDHIDFLRERKMAPAGRLNDYVVRNFSPAFTIDGFEFCVRNGRHITPWLTAEILRREPGAGDPSLDPENALLNVRLILPSDVSIESVEISAMAGFQFSPILLTGPKVRIEVTPLDREGVPTGPRVALRFPFKLQGPSNVALYFDGRGHGFPPSGTLIVVRDSAQREVALARLLP